MRRWLLRVASVLIGAPLLWLAGAFALSSIPTEGRQYDPQGIEVWVVANGYHAGFALPVQAEGIDWRDTFPPEHFPTEIRGYGFVTFGWGEREVYMNTPRIEDLDLIDGAGAIFAFSTSVTHVQYSFRPEAGRYARRLTLSPERYRRLVAHVRDAFKAGRDGRPILIEGRGFAATDAFYEGTGRYSMFYTCNEWVGQGLRRIKAPSALWTPLASHVLRHLE